MKCTITIDETREEEILIYAHEKTGLVSAIEQLVSEATQELIGYKDKVALKLSFNEIFCFTVEDNKVYALTQNDKLLLKRRLYQLAEQLNEGFIKINQSCIVNVGKIRRFDASFSGSMKITLKNGYTDYVSRRQLKNVKERLGL